MRGIWQLDCSSDIVDMAVHVVFVVVADETAGLAEARVVHQVSYHSFCTLTAVDED